LQAETLPTSENFGLVFGAHPTISPLVLSVAAELERRDVIEIFQSRFYQDRIPAETMELVERGFGVLHWTDVVPGKNPKDDGPSLDLMREAMLGGEALAAGIFIGGMEGIFLESDRLSKRQPSTARLPVTAPGGAARQLKPSADAIAERLARALGSPLYPAVAREIVVALVSTRT
jgi:hypothetical protein